MTAELVERLFSPRSIAVLGASADPAKIGGRPVDYLKRFGYQGAIFPVNPARTEVQGLTSYPDVAAIGTPIDQAIVCLPAEQVLDAVEQAAAGGARSCVVLSSGFAEVGGHGVELQNQLAAAVARLDLALLGPNCVGFLIPATGVASTFSTTFSEVDEVRSGSIALVSQSGALATHLQKEFDGRGLGISAYVTTGNEAGLGLADFVAYFAQDPRTRVVCGYLEGVADANRLLTAVGSCVAVGKPVVLVKAGVSAAGGIAAASHTGNLIGGGTIALAALRQAGAIIAESLDELMDICEVADLGQPLRGPRVGVLGISGGTGVLFADAIYRTDLALADLDAHSLERIRGAAPGFASIANPIDLTGKPLWDTHMVGEVLDIVLDIATVDIAVVNLSSGVDDAVGGRWIADLAAARARTDKLIVVNWLSGRPDHLVALRSAGVPAFIDPLRSARAIAALAPSIPSAVAAAVAAAPGKPSARPVIAWPEARTKEWLVDHGLPVPAGTVAATVEECLRAAEGIGYPVVLKAQSTNLTHKSDAGAVVVGLSSPQALAHAATDLLARLAGADGMDDLTLLVEAQVPSGVEVIVAVVNDPVFGLMMAVGVGGLLVELISDVAWRRLPVTAADVDEMITETRVGRLLGGLRGQPTMDREALVAFVCTFGDAVTTLGPALVDIELNPIIVAPVGSGVAVVDALATFAG